MDEILQMQKETVVMIDEYLDNLLPAMEKVLGELSGDMKDDTWEYLHMIIDGFNWVIEAYNGTASLYKANTDRIDEAKLEASIDLLGRGYMNKDSALVVKALAEEGIISFLKILKEISPALTA